ncbi:MAG TPA: ferredoxin [Candidatus Binatia bacterium]|jgi:ferredoxin|nr:ferredoxin [Candidatus Binatia bacterium]
MRVTVDRDKCQAYGACATLCPSVFELDADGFSTTKGDGTVPPGDEEKARAAVRTCPEAAIRVTG